MGILKPSKEKVRDAKILTTIALLCFLVSCVSTAKMPYSKETYEITRYNSINGNTYITLDAYEFEAKDNRFPAAYQINNIIFVTDSIGPFTLHVLKGGFKVNAGAVSKKWTKTDTINIAQGDSVYVKVYLKNDPEPLR